MLRRILLTLDVSENAEKALPWAKQYAAREIAEVILLRVVDGTYLDRNEQAEVLQEARDYLQRIERELNYSGGPCRTLVAQGNPARAIARTAALERCNLIITSTRGGSDVKRWVIGGVTEQVLHLSSVPVLIIRSRTILPRQGHVRRVIVPVDGSKLAEAAVSWRSRLAKVLKAKVVFLQVYPAGRPGLGGRQQKNFQALNERMTRLCRGLNGKGQRAAFNVQRGDAAERILAFADQNDLVVTTTHGSGGFKRWVFGSVAEKLVHDASIPVLVYKTAAQV